MKSPLGAIREQRRFSGPHQPMHVLIKQQNYAAAISRGHCAIFLYVVQVIRCQTSTIYIVQGQSNCNMLTYVYWTVDFILWQFIDIYSHYLTRFEISVVHS